MIQRKYPIYLESYASGKLDKIIAKAYLMLGSCCLCPRKCRVNRLKGEQGYCQTGLKARVYSFIPHHGEEPPISGENGSGTIFFSGCNMRCVYCQNHRFSQGEEGREVEPRQLAEMMLKLQELRCHNINLVTPTHVMPQILKALKLAISKGLRLPLVYNTSGYESPEIIKLLAGIVDIYLADIRYAGNAGAVKYSHAPDYPAYNQEAIKEMHGQAGIAKFGRDGIIKSGLIIRHLVLPEDISGSGGVMEFIARHVSKSTYVSLMSQYLPCYQANSFKELSRRITQEEYKSAQERMKECGLHNGWTQDGYGLESLAGINIRPM